MKLRTTAIVFGVGLIASIGVAVYFFQRPEALAALLLLLPAGKAIKAQGGREQAEKEHVANAEEKAAMQENWRQIDAKTAADREASEQHWKSIREAPTEADEKEMLDRFKGKK